jgi:type VI secretion system protein ImpE
MKAETLLREGKLDEAVDALVAYLRDNPEDAKGRTFLFELLCFRGEYERARKHLALLAQGKKDNAIGALLYEGALQAEELRQKMFETEEYPAALPEGSDQLSGKLNGKPFTSLSDSDPRLGARLEIFAAGDYMWLPLQHVASIHMDAPKKLRDLLWCPAFVKTGPGFQERDLGEILFPVLCPQTARHTDELVRLGRVTEWCADEKGNEYPYGLKMLVVDGEEVPLLEMRSLEIAQAEKAAE